MLKHVEQTGMCCSICHWSRRCYGCAVEPSTQNAADLKSVLLKSAYIACEWDIDFFEAQTDTSKQDWQEDESVGKMTAELDKPYPLMQCLQLFSKSDKLNVNCNYCKKDQPMVKQTMIQQCPPILILHLKRFRMTSK